MRRKNFNARTSTFLPQLPSLLLSFFQHRGWMICGYFCFSILTCCFLLPILYSSGTRCQLLSATQQQQMKRMCRMRKTITSMFHLKQLLLLLLLAMVKGGQASTTKGKRRKNTRQGPPLPSEEGSARELDRRLDRNGICCLHSKNDKRSSWNKNQPRGKGRGS